MVLLSTSFVGLAGYYLWKIRPTVNNTTATILLSLSALTLFITMTLAFGYSLGRFTTLFYFAIPDMVQWHGWLNALGFAGLGILGWNFVQPPAIGHAYGIPFSRIVGHLHIGATFFEKIGAVDEGTVVHGLVDDLSDYADDDCRIGKLITAYGSVFMNILTSMNCMCIQYGQTNSTILRGFTSGLRDGLIR